MNPSCNTDVLISSPSRRFCLFCFSETYLVLVEPIRLDGRRRSQLSILWKLGDEEEEDDGRRSENEPYQASPDSYNLARHHRLPP